MVTALILLYLSDALDTVDYSVFLDRLSDLYSISCAALTWIRSLLTNRSQSIRNRKLFFSGSSRVCGVHQDSVFVDIFLSLFGR